ITTGVYHQGIVRPFSNFVRKRRHILRESRMVHVGGVCIRLRRAYQSGRAVIAANAALTILGEINVVSQENRKGIRGYAQIRNERVELRIEPVNVHESRGESEHRSSLART